MTSATWSKWPVCFFLGALSYPWRYMATTNEEMRDLHDASLESLELHWSAGETILHVLTGSSVNPRRVIVASSTRRIECDRRMPWGFSRSIHDVRGPTSSGDAFVLEIEMQSGDLIRIEAGAFDLRTPTESDALGLGFFGRSVRR